MCYGMRCPYERHDGPEAGECTLRGVQYPADAACSADRFDCDNCDNGAFTECDGHCMEE